ncbi:MAG: hypothetical protein ACRDRJ_22940 [Streptosporangiaceae bacterium]
MRQFLLGDGHTLASHAGHLVLVAGAGLAIWFLVALVWRLSGRRTQIRFAAPPAGARGGSGSSNGGLLGPVIAAAAVLGFGYFYDTVRRPAATAAAAVRATASPSVSPTASPSPKPVPTVTEITRMVNAHPLLSGWQIVLICGIAVVLILGGLSLARRFF